MQILIPTKSMCKRIQNQQKSQKFDDVIDSKILIKNRKLKDSLNFNLRKSIPVHVKIELLSSSHNRTLSIFNANTDTCTIHV